MSHFGVRTIALGVVVEGRGPATRVLISRRPAGAVLGGYWEFPGGKVEAGETVEDALRRELREELGIEIEPTRLLTSVEHEYPHAAVRLVPYICKLSATSPAPRALQVAEWRWVSPRELQDYRFPEANAGLLADVVAMLGGVSDSAATDADSAQPQTR